MGRNRRRCEKRVTITSGSIFRNVNTDFIEVAIENITFCPQTVTVSVLNQQNTCNGTEFPKYGYLCGDLVNYTGNGTRSTSDNSDTNDNGECELFYPPEGVTPVLTPFTFTIPPRQLFVVRAFPQDPLTPPSPYYKVQVTMPVDPVSPTDPITPVDPVSPTDPITPVDPVRPIIVNTWGISSAGVIQNGNTVLHSQFRFQPGDPIRPVDPV